MDARRSRGAAGVWHRSSQAIEMLELVGGDPTSQRLSDGGREVAGKLAAQPAQADGEACQATFCLGRSQSVHGDGDDNALRGQIGSAKRSVLANRMDHRSLNLNPIDRSGGRGRLTPMQGLGGEGDRTAADRVVQDVHGSP